MREAPTIHPDSKNRFHYGNSTEPTVSINEMTVVWGTRNESADNGDERWNLHREIGPARIIITGLQKWHDKGILHRRRGDAIICKQVTFTWAKNGHFLRPDGPYHISLRGFNADASKGVVSNIRLNSLVPSWATINGRKLAQADVRDVIKDQGLKVNLLAFGSVFLNAEDEVVFLTEIPEERKK